MTRRHLVVGWAAFGLMLVAVVVGKFQPAGGVVIAAVAALVLAVLAVAVWRWRRTQPVVGEDDAAPYGGRYSPQTHVPMGSKH